MEDEIAETEYCSNCRRDIPAANYVMHVTHCQRNLTLCKVCSEPVPTSQQEEHFEENHVKVKCDCGEQVEKMNLEEHKEKDCPSRLVKCQYCELEITFSELTSHVEYCGSRTEKCEICDRYIQKKDLEAHVETGCQYPVKEEKKSIPSKGPDNLFSEMSVGMLHAMGLMNSSQTGPDMENFFPFATGMREFGKILSSRLGTPPFNGANYFGDVDLADTPFDGRDVIARGTRGMAKPRTDHRSTDSFEHVDIDYTQQSSDDDEMLATAYQADEFDDANGTYGTSSRIVHEPFPNIQSSATADLANDTTQLPCEFCGELLPLDSLILHQSGCQLRSFDSFPSSGSADVFFDGTPMYNVPPRNSSTDVMHEDVAGNHKELASEDYKDDADVTFLPCEFCQELFPYENLIQHQAVCDAGPPSLAPSVLHNGSAQPPLNNSRSEARRGARSRPSRPVYERKKIQKSIETYIPRELDDFGPDSLDVTRNENGLNREKDDYRFDEVSSAPMNNEVPRRTNRGRALDRETLLRNTADDTAAKKQLQRKTSGDGAAIGQIMTRNNDLPYRQPRKEASRAKSLAVDQPGKRPSELRNGFTSASHQAPTVKPTERSMGQRKMNTGAARKPADEQAGKRPSELRNGLISVSHQAPAVKPTERSMGQRKMNTGAARKPADEQASRFRVQRAYDSNNRTKPIHPRVNEAAERSKRDSSTKLLSQVDQSDTRSNKPPRTGSVNLVFAAEVRSAAARTSETKFQDSHKTVNPPSASATHMTPPNPRRNPATFKIEGIPVNNGRGQTKGTTSESRPSDTQAPTPLKRKMTKKVV